MLAQLGLRARILLGVLLVTFAGVLSAGLLSLWLAGLGARVEHAARARDLGRVAAVLVEARLAGRAPGVAPRVLFERAAPLIARAIGAEQLDWLEAATPAGTTDAEGVLRAIERETPVTLEHGQDATRRVVVYARVTEGDLVVGVVRAVVPWAAAAAAVGKAWIALLFLAAIDGLILFLGAAWVLRRTIVGPVLALEATAARVAEGNLAARVPLRGPGELGQLADAFDRMTASLADGREAVIRHEKLAGVGRLAAGIAHEIGNPLAAVLGYAEMLIEDAREGGRALTPELRADMLARVRGETQRINRIVHDLLDLARPPRTEREAVDVPRVLEAAVSLARATGRARDVDLALDVPADLPQPVASSGHVTQILLNLLLNGADATSGAGHIWVSARADERVVRIAVEDDGPGVPPGLRRAIFDPFFTTKEPGAGTGLGLSVSLALAETLGGALRLETRAGGEPGARFVLELPRTRPPDVPTA